MYTVYIQNEFWLVLEWTDFQISKPTKVLWIGGLGPEVTTNLLQRECNKFGSIYNIKWDSGIIEKYLEKKLKEKW